MLDFNIRGLTDFVVFFEVLRNLKKPTVSIQLELSVASELTGHLFPVGLVMAEYPLPWIADFALAGDLRQG